MTDRSKRRQIEASIACAKTIVELLEFELARMDAPDPDVADTDDAPGTYTQAELLEIVKEMHHVADRVYWFFFTKGMGAKVHAYIEFCGLLNKYVQICSRAALNGIDFTVANIHSRTRLPVEVHDMVYLGEKLQCIFGPMLAANPAGRDALRDALFGDS